jgi:hypothetical protein
MARWLASWSELAGIVELEESGAHRRRRLTRERRRVGLVRLADVIAFRVWYAARQASADARRLDAMLGDLHRRFPAPPDDTPRLRSPSPNTAAVESFVRDAAPDVVIALCKQIIKPSVFRIPRVGTFVLHPGICPEYRNAHGCFWALANDDTERVGMTLLRIDEGVDTGPVFGYFTYAFDELTESHIVIQHRVVLENLDAIAARLREVAAGTAPPIPTNGRRSAAWGQPWLSAYLRWQRHARRRHARRRA